MVFPFGLPKPEADPSDLLFHAQCFHWWRCGWAERNTEQKVRVQGLPRFSQRLPADETSTLI